MTKLIVAMAALGIAVSVLIAQDTAPTSARDGDMWRTAAGTFARINGSIQGPLYNLYARKAEWKMQDTGLVKSAPCNPSEPSGSGTVCGDKMQALVWECPEGTIGIFPQEAANWGLWGWPGKKDGKPHPDVYCIFAYDPNIPVATAH